MKNSKELSTFDKIRQIVKTIPLGKVSTYGIIAQMIGISNPRVVGWAMSSTKEKAIPCHRVVKKDGTLSKNFGFGGFEEQMFLLQKEGVTFLNYKNRDIPKVDLEKYLWIGD